MITGSIAGPGATAAITPSQPARPIASDFETFLRMLTVQMQNQDPLNPIDSSDYAVQLATFSSVEQQVQTNTLLSQLGTQLTTSGMADVATWVGREARHDGPVHFTGTPITLVPDPAPTADQVQLLVRNAAGEVVQTLDLPVSSDPIEWAGVDSGGRPFPLGRYEFEIVNLLAGETINATPAETYGIVREVRNEGGTLSVLFDGGINILANKITALRQINS